MKTYTNSEFGNYTEAEVSIPLKASGADFVGGKSSFYAEKSSTRCVPMIGKERTTNMLETESSSSMNVLNDGMSDMITATYYKGPGAAGGHERPYIAYGFDPGATRDAGQLFLEEQSKTLANGSCPGHHNGIVKENEMEKKYVVRRLCPDECAALQGYPKDWVNIGEWTDSKGKKHKDSDSPKYKAYGNSIAVPAWGFIINGIEAELRKGGVKTPKMGSLFDGIGGFPLLWEHFGGKAVWASEIEEFCIAVTKIRFPEEGEE